MYPVKIQRACQKTVNVTSYLEKKAKSPEIQNLIGYLAFYKLNLIHVRLK